MARAKTKAKTGRRGTPAPKPRKSKPSPPVVHRFAKGNPGKPKGAKNKFGLRLKEAILEAAERSGRDGKGKDGTVGYLVWLSRSEPAVYGRMLEKILPMQLEVKDKREQYTPEEARQALIDRGLPVPQSLEELVVREIKPRLEEEADNDEFNDLAPDTPEIYSEDDPMVDTSERPEDEEDE